MQSYRLTARARAQDGTITPFSLEIMAPKEYPEGEYGCVVHCPTVRFHGKPIFGVDGRQAMALAFWIVEDLLRHEELTLIDDDGVEITLPVDREGGIPGGPDRTDL